MSQNLESGQKSKTVPYQNLSKLSYLDLAFMADKGQNLVLNLRNIYITISTNTSVCLSVHLVSVTKFFLRLNRLGITP